VVNVNRGGPGLGTIQPAQGDYFQATKGGGHGDYRLIVLAPASVQEMADMVYLGFDLADKYRNPVMILADGALGQMMEKVRFPDYDPKERVPAKPWATTGKTKDRERNILTSLHIQPEQMEEINRKLQKKYEMIVENEVRYQLLHPEGAEILVVAYGLAARITHRAVEMARAKGRKVAMLRPITLYPFPYPVLRELRSTLKGAMSVEMNMGQMVEDVRLGVEGAVPVHFYGRTGGIIPTPEEVLSEIVKFADTIENSPGVFNDNVSVIQESR
jgi:2-oxoglutarate ferredoxin oxidoreductase subunit alpha